MGPNFEARVALHLKTSDTASGCQLMCICVLSRSVMFDSVTAWTVAHLAPLTMGLFWQEYWSGLPCLPPGDLPNPGLKRVSPLVPALADRFFTTAPPGKPQNVFILTPKIVTFIVVIIMNHSNRIWQKTKVIT